MEFPLHLLENYSPLRVLVFGLTTAFSFTGTGLWTLEMLFKKKISLTLAIPIGTLLGIQLFSLSVQFLGFAHLASPENLKTLWFTQVFFGVILLLWGLARLKTKVFLSCAWGEIFSLKTSKTSVAIACSLVLLLMLTLFVSLAPSTKIDELYYHMLVPLRLLQDGGLFFYREPWPAMMPHMHFQIVAAPLYALGVVDALNTTSWWLGSILAWFFATTVFKKTKNMEWALLVSLGMYAGMYAPVWFVTGGSGAVSVLAMAVLAFVTLERKDLVEHLGGLAFVPLISILSMTVATSKLSYLAFAILCLTICSFSVWRGLDYKRMLTIALLAWSAWIVFYLPALLWTWISSGYPLGTMQDPAFAEKIASTRLIYHSLRGFLTQVTIHFADLTPLVWGGCLLFVLSPRIQQDRSVWLTGIVLLLFQGVVIWLKLPRSPRFFGGLPHGIALYFWIDATRNAPVLLKGLFASRRIYLALLGLILPWILVPLYYSAQFLPVVTGVESVEFFAGRLIPMYDDFRQLDKLLPENAVLFVEDFSIGSVYAPRPVIFDKRDLWHDLEKKPQYLIQRSFTILDKWKNFCSTPVYQNEESKTSTFRTPGRKPALGPLAVFRLKPSTKSEVKE